MIWKGFKQKLVGWFRFHYGKIVYNCTDWPANYKTNIKLYIVYCILNCVFINIKTLLNTYLLFGVFKFRQYEFRLIIFW